MANVTHNQTEARILAELENDLRMILCTKLQLDTIPILKHILKEKIAPIILFTNVNSNLYSEENQASNKLKKIDLRGFSHCSLSPSVVMGLNSLMKEGCKILLPSIERTKRRANILEISNNTSKDTTKLYKIFKKDGFKAFFNLETECLETFKYKNMVESFELYPLGNFLEYTEIEYNIREAECKNKGFLIDSTKSTGLIINPLNKFYQNLYNAYKTNLRAFVKCKTKNIIKLCSKFSKLKIGTSWYDSKMVYKVCNTILSMHPDLESDELIFAVSKKAMPLLIRNPKVPVIGTVAPLIKKQDKLKEKL